jgi:hypothetical protein
MPAAELLAATPDPGKCELVFRFKSIMSTVMA